MIFIIIAFTRRILNCINANRRENHTLASPVSRPPLTEDPILVAPPESQGSFFFVMILSSRYYREFIFIHYSYVTFYVCSFPHNNINTYIMYIFRVNISIHSVRMTQLFYILIYSINMKVYCYCPISNCYCLTLNYYCLTFPTVTV
jgi:hypothetical protein